MNLALSLINCRTKEFTCVDGVEAANGVAGASVDFSVFVVDWLVGSSLRFLLIGVSAKFGVSNGFISFPESKSNVESMKKEL
jgi:hypothetical protein